MLVPCSRSGDLLDRRQKSEGGRGGVGFEGFGIANFRAARFQGVKGQGFGGVRGLGLQCLHWSTGL